MTIRGFCWGLDFKLSACAEGHQRAITIRSRGGRGDLVLSIKFANGKLSAQTIRSGSRSCRFVLCCVAQCKLSTHTVADICWRLELKFRRTANSELSAHTIRICSGLHNLELADVADGERRANTVAHIGWWLQLKFSCIAHSKHSTHTVTDVGGRDKFELICSARSVGQTYSIVEKGGRRSLVLICSASRVRNGEAREAEIKSLNVACAQSNGTNTRKVNA